MVKKTKFKKMYEDARTLGDLSEATKLLTPRQKSVLVKALEVVHRYCGLYDAQKSVYINLGGKVL